MDKCPRCGEALDFEEVDIGVGTLRGNPGCPACFWTPALKKFVSWVQVTQELLRGADHTKHDIWNVAAPWDAVRSTVSVEKLRISPREQHRADSVTVCVIGWAERKAAEDEDDDEELRVTMECPKCGAEQEDLDGFGLVFCPACGYCTHPSRATAETRAENGSDICGLCGKRVTTCQRCGGSGAIRGMEAGFGGVDHGAECGDCEGAGIIVEEVA